MKRSKVFLGATAFILAVAGAYATKASNRIANVTAYSKPAAGGCGASVLKFCTAQPQDNRCTNAAGHTLYTNFIAGCNHTLYTKGLN